MAAPTANPTTTIHNSDRNDETRLYKYPSDVDKAPIYMTMHFLQYIRPNSSDNGKFLNRGHIALPLPLNLGEEFELEYANRELTFFGNDWRDVQATAGSFGESLVGGANFTQQNFMDIVRGNTTTIMNGGRGAAVEVGKFLTLMTPNFLQETFFGDAVSNALKIVRNPHFTAVFDAVKLRSHKLEWLFSPRNKQESIDLEHIFNAIRANAHPSFTPGMGQFALDFPYQCFCNFVGTDYVFPIKRAVITAINMDFGPGGQMQFYKGGGPVQVKFGLTLTEVQALTRADFEGNPAGIKDGSYAKPTYSTSTSASAKDH